MMEGPLSDDRNKRVRRKEEMREVIVWWEAITPPELFM